MPPLPRGRCSTCGRVVALVKSGVAREHVPRRGDTTRKCEGSWQPPADVAVEALEAPQEASDGDVRTSVFYELALAARAAVHAAPAVVDGEMRTCVTVIEGLQAVRRMRSFVDGLEAELVAKARERSRPSWWGTRRELHSLSQIAEALGVPKSTVHRRYGPGSG